MQAAIAQPKNAWTHRRKKESEERERDFIFFK